MERRRPTPLCKCFVLCGQIFTDSVSQSHALIAPVHQVFPRHYPTVVPLSVFARWTNAHGAYAVGLRVRSLEDGVVWQHALPEPFETSDPLQVWVLTLRSFAIPLAKPGKYEVDLLADGEAVATDLLTAHPAEPRVP